MSDQRFTGLQRFAIWKIHAERCFWCHHQLKFRHMHVDHIIPEMIQPTDFDRMKVQYNLPSTFDLHGYENLVPSCPECNGDKGARLFEETPAMMWQLQLAAERAPKVFPFMHEYRKEKRDAKKIVDQEPDYDSVQVIWHSDESVDVVIRRWKPMGTGSDMKDFWPTTRTHKFYRPGKEPKQDP